MSRRNANPNYRTNGFLPGEGFSFDAAAFDQAIQTQGVSMVHYRAIICPLGIVDKNDTLRREHPPHAGCSNGVIYKKMGYLPGLFVDNSENQRDQDIGIIDGSNARCSFPRFYTETCEPSCDGKPKRVYVGTGDRFYLDERNSDLLWLTRELVEHSLSLEDRLRFPAVEVEHLIDNRLVEYKQGEDFEITPEGYLKWKVGHGPGIDAETENARGRVYTVWYLYRPFWYVDRIIHQGRPTQVQGDGERHVEAMPMEVNLVKEVQYQNERAGGDNPTGRENPPPRDGSFA